MNNDKLQQIISDSVDEAVKSIKSYVNEFIDSTSEQMDQEINDLKAELFNKYEEIADQ